MRRKYQKKIKQIVDEFKKIKPKKVILFGSVVSGEMDKNSDIDICVIKKNSDRLKLKRHLREIIWKTKIGFQPEIELHVYSPDVYLNWLKRKDPFISEIEKGEVVYER